ncbi:ABC transporter permease [Proteinivorax hydrogeniformans]|uniref:ABC transporter permease n=1 Tax=Proteinivorax hydrogeniformans TaxID=1826727 RepID=A0AAU8HNQ4_9FIRM
MLDILTQIFSLSMMFAGLRMATPLILASLGGILSERSGVINIALEGMILTGAFFAVWGSYTTGNPWFGVLLAIVAGMVLASIHALVSVYFKADQVVSGTAINILATGLTVYLLQILFGVSGTSPRAVRLPAWSLGTVSFNPMVYLALILVPIIWFVLYKTPWGLRIRAVGEHPQAADTVGINVNRWRFICVTLSGAFAGLAGVSIAIGEGSYFVNGMSSGRGFIALAAMIFGKWNPFGALGASLLFGFTEAIALRADFQYIPSQLVRTLPYIITIIVLAGFIGKARPPKAVGKPYNKGER